MVLFCAVVCFSVVSESMVSLHRNFQQCETHGWCLYSCFVSSGIHWVWQPHRLSAGSSCPSGETSWLFVDDTPSPFSKFYFNFLNFILLSSLKKYFNSKQFHSRRKWYKGFKQPLNFRSSIVSLPLKMFYSYRSFTS